MNNNIRLTYFIGFLLFLFLFSTCKPKKELSKKELKELIDEVYTTEQILAKLKENEFKFDGLSIKATVEYNANGKKNSFKSTLRIKNDSAIWVSVTPLMGIEVARALITPDTVLVIDRIHSTYFAGNFSYINKVFNVDLDFKMLQSLIIGNSIEFEENEKIFSQIDKHMFFLGTTKKRRVKKAIKKDKESKLKDDNQSIWLDPESFKIKELFITDHRSEQSLRAVYSEHQKLEEQFFPVKMRFFISSNQNAYLGVEFSKITEESDLNMPFSIPEKYEPVEIK
ncbi:MAG: DUF4292 domain-containing protein [Bacteroidetes bacterium]|nr:DUF4292 domain-containing protein [Bacteroidota bacterium]MBV6461701.1 hypothetical protein [Flavobacteriales bacterium]WKZ75104.1 MAG: DUF4292 domain-containing protein [Vicingaceae bacterium]MCL4815485.1 DUF4292 domain-containing protein [Flavobacteriales bacterium]NOG96077.1 DUF4292 domain-containing protein [Bacteroidota bacterium]